MNILEMLNRMTLGRAVILGLIVAAIYYFIVFDEGIAQKSSIATATQQVNDLQKKIRENQIKLDRAAVYKKTSAEIGTTINKLLGVIPEHFGKADLMKIVSNEAKVAGSSLIGIVPGIPEVSKVAKEFEELTVKLEMNGTFLQHMIFLSNLTKINQILIVRKFDMNVTKEAKGDEGTIVHLNADIVAYRYRGNLATTEPGKTETK